MLELLESDGGSIEPDQRQSMYRDIKSSVAVLLEMTTQLLNLHRLESGAMQVQKEPLQHHLLVDQVHRSLEQRIREKGIRFGNAYPPGQVVEADVALLREVILASSPTPLRSATRGRRSGWKAGRAEKSS